MKRMAYDVELAVGNETVKLYFESLDEANSWVIATLEAVSEYDNPERYTITIRPGGEKK